MVNEKIIQRGAEAVLIRNGDIVLKRRVVKGYRLKELDEKLRKSRTKKEAKLLEKAGKLICVPRVLKVNERDKELDIEFIDGLKLSDNLDSMKNWKEVCFAIGENIAKLHDAGIIHGDLTTSNMIWKLDSSSLVGKARPLNTTKLDAQAKKRASQLYQLAPLAVAAHSVRKLSRKPAHGDDKINGGAIYLTGEGKLYFIDFGLGFENGKTEDKAVDLYLIKEALEAKHFEKFEEYFAAVLRGYKTSKNWKEVLNRLEKVEKRGRYKGQY